MKLNFFLVVTLIFSLHAQDKKYLIGSIKVKPKSISAMINSEFRRSYLKHNFYVSYDYSDLDLTQAAYEIVTLPVVLNVIAGVWHSNKSWYIPSMDEDLYYSLKKIKESFKLLYPRIAWDGELIPERLVKHSHTDSSSYETNRGSVGIMFSGGLDAMCASMNMYGLPQLLLVCHGSDVPLKNEAMWAQVRKKTATYAQQMGHDIAYIESNFFSLYKTKLNKEFGGDFLWRTLTSVTFGYGGIVAPILVLKGYPWLLIASSRTSAFPFGEGVHPLIDHKLCFAGISCFHHGGQWSRPEKMGEILRVCNRYDLPVPFMRTCWNKDPNGGNCGECVKCVRFYHNLLVEGEDPGNHGMPKTVQTMRQDLENMLHNGALFTGSKVWHWRCNQERYKMHRAEGKVYAPEIVAYLDWLCTIDFASYNRHSSSWVYDFSRKEELKKLWDESMDESLKKLHAFYQEHTHLPS